MHRLRSSCRLRLSAALPLSAALLLAACAGPPPGGDLEVVVAGEPEQATAMAETLAAEASRATLITRAGNGALAPGLATSWRFLDEGNDLILRLAPVRWPGKDGKPGPELEARDVVAGLRRLPKSARPALDAAGLAGRGTARAPIARVVELTPRPATPFLLDWLADPALAVVDRRGRLFPGPYERARADGEIRLTRRGDLVRPDAQAATIVVKTAEPSAAIARYVARDRPLVLGAGLAGLADARAAGQGRALRIEPVHGVIGLAINSKGTLADARLRRALLLASDGAAVASRFGLGALTAQTRLWDGLPAPADDRARPLAERQAMAAALLADVGGLGPGKPLTLTIVLPAGPEASLLADALSAALAPVGIMLRPVRAPRGAGSSVPPHDLALAERVAHVPDPAAHLARWQCGQAQPCSTQADALLAGARRAGSDLAARAEAVDRAEQAMMADPAFIPLLRPVRWSLVPDGLSGFEANPLGWHPLGRISRAR